MSRAKLLNVAKVLLTVTALGFLGFAIWAAVGSLRHEQFSLNVPYLGVAVLLCAIFFFLQAFVWDRCLGRLGYDMGGLAPYATWFLSQVVKYVPGKVMLPLYRVMFCSRRGVPKTHTLLSILVEVVLMTVSSMLVFFAMLPFLSRNLDDRIALPMLVLCCVAGMVVIHPKVLNFGLNLALRIVRRDPVRIDFSYRALLGLLAIYCLAWLVYGLATVFVLMSVAEPWDVGLRFYFAVSAGFLISWTLGFLSFMTPGGIGVREAILTAVLAPFVTTSVALTVSVLGRLVWMASEMIGAALTFAWRPRPEQKP